MLTDLMLYEVYNMYVFITYYLNTLVRSIYMGVVCVLTWFNMNWLGSEYRFVAWESEGGGSRGLHVRELGWGRGFV
jgi:hypothetical protein